MKKVLQDLIFLGRVEKEVTVFGKKWKMITLDSDEHLKATNSTGNYDNLSRLYALKVEILSRAIQGIDGIVIEDEIEGRELVTKLQPPVVNKLYDEYEKMQQKQNDSLNELDDIKN